MSAATSGLRVEDGELAELVSAGAAALDLALPAHDVDRLVVYVRMIERWNATYNLTAIRDVREMVPQHLLDCLAAAAALARRRGARTRERVVDVGSGAGLPGIVIALALPGREVTCVDSVGKKAAFITQAAGALGLGNLRSVHSRIEHLAGRFDVVTSRAFAAVGDFVAQTEHLLGASGVWMAMKGKTPEPELGALPADVAFHVEPLTVPGLSADRCIVWIEQSQEASARL